MECIANCKISSSQFETDLQKNAGHSYIMSYVKGSWMEEAHAFREEFYSF
jgi:hypothetical protein